MPPGEIIHLQVGQCGNSISTPFWSSIAEEHGLDATGNLASSPSAAAAGDLGRQVFFSERTDGVGNETRFSARAILVDLNEATLDNIRAGPSGRLFMPHNFVTRRMGAGGNWAKGHYTDGVELASDVLDAVRKEAEACDCLQGFQLSMAIGGGSGSGMGTLLLSKIREEFPDRMMFSYSVLPSPKVSETVVEPYNAVLSLHQLVENADGVMCLDNESLYDICRAQSLASPSYGDINRIVGDAMAGATSPLRFTQQSGGLNGDLRKIAVNLVPFPRVHFFLLGLAPLIHPRLRSKTNSNSGNLDHYHTFTVPQLTTLLMEPSSMMAAINPRSGRYLAATAIFRGHASAAEVDREMGILRSSSTESAFVDWIPDNLKACVCTHSPLRDSNMSAVLLANNTAMVTVFNRLLTQFNALFRRKAFLHLMAGEGMDEMELTEAQSNAADLVAEYQQYQESSSSSSSSSDAVTG